MKDQKIYRSNFYGNFSRLSAYYSQARQAYAQEVVDYCTDLIGQGPAVILDIGCGTGISTRQLAAKGYNLVGIDSSYEMLTRALSDYYTNIRYVTARAERLPFKPGVFDVVTVFGAFHWFNAPKAVTEIKRVLKRGGACLIVNKTDTGGFIKKYREIIESISKTKLPDVKRSYDPVSILRRNRFSSVKLKKFTIPERLSISQALILYRSISLWNLIPHGFRSKVINALKEYLKNQDRSYVLRPIKTTVVSGINPDRE